MNVVLDAYLFDVERALKGLTPGRCSLILRELEAHLRDEAEARGIRTEAEMAALLREKEDPAALAAELSQGEGTDTTHRSESALIGGALIGLATGGYLYLQGGWPWFLAMAFCVVQGLAVSAGIFLVRRRWQSLSGQNRILTSMAFGTLMAIPLGFTSVTGFNGGRLIYGAFTGYMMERHAQNRPVWQAIAEILSFTLLDFLLYTYLFAMPKPYAWLLELSFNFTLALGVLLAIQLKRLLAGRWLLAPQ